MDWEVGQALTPLPKATITREQLWEYADASGDRNAIHLYEDFAKDAGFPSVIVHGMLSMAFLADLVAMNFPTPRYRTHRLKTKFRKVTFPGDTLRCEGKVRSRLPDGRVVLTLTAVNQHGEVTADGEAEVSPQ